MRHSWGVAEAPCGRPSGRLAGSVGPRPAQRLTGGGRPSRLPVRPVRPAGRPPPAPGPPAAARVPFPLRRGKRPHPQPAPSRPRRSRGRTARTGHRTERPCGHPGTDVPPCSRTVVGRRRDCRARPRGTRSLMRATADRPPHRAERGRTDRPPGRSRRGPPRLAKVDEPRTGPPVRAAGAPATAAGRPRDEGPVRPPDGTDRPLPALARGTHCGRCRRRTPEGAGGEPHSSGRDTEQTGMGPPHRRTHRTGTGDVMTTAARPAPPADRDVHELVLSPRCARLPPGHRGGRAAQPPARGPAAPAPRDGTRPAATRRGRVQPGSGAARGHYSP